MTKYSMSQGKITPPSKSSGKKRKGNVGGQKSLKKN